MHKYQRAQQRVTDGLWSVDASAGLVTNQHGKRLGSRTSHGYVFLSMTPTRRGAGNQNVYAHKVIWESVHGPVPHDLQVNHINGVKHDNRIVNLELVTASGNIQHAVDTGLLTQPSGEAAHNAKVTLDQVRDIRSRAESRETHQSIAESVGISRQQVGRIVNRKRWAAA